MNTALRQWVWSHPRLTAPLRAVWRALPANLKSIDGWSASKRDTYQGVFDAVWYLADNPDVAASGMDPLSHYLGTGWREGRDPNPLFDVSWYLSQHPEIGYFQTEPLEHYLQWGWRERWDPHPLFDAGWYSTRYQVETCPLIDYLGSGIAKGRLVHPEHRAVVLDIDTRTPVGRQGGRTRWATVYQPNRAPVRSPMALVPWDHAEVVTIDVGALRGSREPEVTSDIDRDVLEVLSRRDTANKTTYLVVPGVGEERLRSELSSSGVSVGGSIRIVDRRDEGPWPDIHLAERQSPRQPDATVVIPDTPARPRGWAALRSDLGASARSAIGAHPSPNLMITRSIEAAYDSALLPTALIAAAVEEADVAGLNAVHYMSREGAFLARLHEVVAPYLAAGPVPPTPIHLALSRRSTFGPTLGSFTAESLMAMWRMYKSQSLRALIVSLGDDVERYRKAARRHHLPLDELIHDVHRDKRVGAFLEDEQVQRMLSECNRTRRRALDAYLDRTWDVHHDRLVVVDVGWRGTIQDNLARGFPSLFFTGWYLALFPFLNPQPPNVAKSAVGPNGNLDHPYEFMQPPAAVERPWTPDVPSTIDYQLDPESGAVPVEEQEMLGRTERSLIEAFQDAAMDAAKIVAIWIAAEGLRTEDLQPFVRSEVTRYYTKPAPGVADIWFSSAHDDTFGALNVTPFGKIVPSASWLSSGLGSGYRATLEGAAEESRWNPGYRRWLPVEALTHLERAIRTRNYRADES